jgi:predicted dehydrogenase
MTFDRKLRCAMVGGGRDAFIGAVHRKAMALDGRSNSWRAPCRPSPARPGPQGRTWDWPDDRNHGSWQELLADELRRPPGERIDFVSIVTPNHVHYAVAAAFVEAGFHVVCDKPLVHDSVQAEALVRAVRQSGTVFGVTYNYTGYPMVREARHLVRTGVLGEVRKVTVEYNQGWLATAVEGAGQQAGRLAPGSGAQRQRRHHGRHRLACGKPRGHSDGLALESICADLTAFGEGRQLDDDGHVLLRYSNGARGVIIASQVAAGVENDLRLQVSGTLGTITWRQEEPNQLVHSPIDGPRRILTRGSPWLCESARRPAGCLPATRRHFIEAFANVYLGIAADIRAHSAGLKADPTGCRLPARRRRRARCALYRKGGGVALSERKWTRSSGRRGCDS